MTMAIWKKETGEMLFFEPKDYYALVDLKTLRMVHVLEISSENDVNRLIDGKKKFRRRALAEILSLLYLCSQTCSGRCLI